MSKPAIPAILTIGWLLLFPGSAVAQPPIPLNHCAVKLPFAGMADRIEAMVEEELAGEVIDVGAFNLYPIVDDVTYDVDGDSLTFVIEVDLRDGNNTTWVTAELPVTVRFLNEAPPDPDPFDWCDTGLAYPNVVVSSMLISILNWNPTDMDECDVQTRIQEIFDNLLDRSFGEDNFELSGREMVADSGGFIVTSHNLYIQIPCVPVSPDEPRCAYGGHCAFSDPHVIDLNWVASYSADIPKMVHQAVEADLDAQDLQIIVVCNHGMDCSGIGDADHDGVCDPDDLCPHTFTGSHCDIDQDGRGDGYLAFTPSYCGLAVTSEEHATAERILQLKQLFCGGCDNCEGDHGLADLDEDRVGDACDLDLDGDGVANDWDCAPYHEWLAADWDGDRVCDHYERFSAPLCRMRCHDLAAAYGADFNLLGCIGQCNQLDNCIYADEASEPFCGEVRASCSPVGAACDLDAFLTCQMIYGNPDQSDVDHDGLGDACERGVDHITLRPLDHGAIGHSGLPASFHCTFSGDTYEVAFRARGGDIEQTDSGPQYEPEVRTAVTVGACACRTGIVQGWDVDCWLHECSGYDETGGDGDQWVWNPINASEINGTDPEPPHSLLYPVHCDWSPGGECSDNLGTIYQRALIHDRDLPFSLDESANLHTFTWDWQHATQLEAPNVSVDYDPHAVPGEFRTTRVRAAWPNFADPVVIDYVHEVAYSEPHAMSAHHQRCGGEIYLGPPFIVSIIPHIVDLWSDPSPERIRPAAAHLIGQDPLTGNFGLHRLGPSALQIESAQALRFPDVPPNREAAMVGQIGNVYGGFFGAETAYETALMLYQPPGRVGAEDGPNDLAGPAGRERLDVAENPQIARAKMFMGVLPGDARADGVDGVDRIDLIDLTTVIDGPVPTVYDAQMVYLPGTQQILLFGHASSRDMRPMAWRLSLDGRQWTGPTALALPDGLRGYTLNRDAAGDRIYLFGGQRTDSRTGALVASAAVFTIDPVNLVARRVRTSAPDVDLGRSQAGSHLDPLGNQLYIYGGIRSERALRDAWRLDLRTGRWHMLSAPESPIGAPSVAPPAGPDPFVYFDSHHQRLWAGDLRSQDNALWTLGPYGDWHERQTEIAPAPAGWPVTQTYVPGQIHSYIVPEDPDAAWPGRLQVAELVADSPGLGLRVRSQRNEIIAESRRVVPGVERAAFVCAPGERCMVGVRLTPSEGSAEWMPFELDVRPSTPVETNRLRLRGAVRDLQLGGDTLHVATARAVYAIDADTLEIRSELDRPAARQGRALEPCGPYLCLARTSLRGLTVLDLSDPAGLRVAARSWTAGLAWDVAARGQRVFLAHGWFGVGVYDIGSDGRPHYRGSFQTGGVARHLAIDSDRLAVARGRRQVQIYDVSATPRRIGALRPRHAVTGLRFVDGRLWVATRHGQRVEIWDVSLPDAPSRLADLSPESAPAFGQHWHGARGFMAARRDVQVLEARLDGE